MYMADAQAVVASVIHGPDHRTRITPDTHRVMFVTYAPKGIGEDALRHHLAEIERYVRIVSPEAQPEEVDVWGR